MTTVDSSQSKPRTASARTPSYEPRPASPASVHEAFERLRKNRWAMAHTTAKERAERIRKLRDATLARRDELCRAIHDDFRKNAVEVELTEIFPVVSEANHAIHDLAKWMKPQRAKTPLALFGTRSHVHYEPKGVVLILAPWNYPFQLLIAPLIAAIAAGNVAAVRPSSKVPHTSRFIASLLGDVFPADEVAVFEGDHAVSDALLELPFDHVFFTGSPKIGKKVMAAASRHLASVTLELGGKSPAIVDRSADVAKAAERILWGKFVNAGQTCVAPDYLLIEHSRQEEFVREAQRVLTRRYGDSEEARHESPSFCRVVSDEHLRGLTRVLDAAKAAGAKVAAGGVARQDERYLAPTLLTNVEPENPIMAEEIFGPILPIVPFRELDDAIDIINSKPKPLALYAFSRDDHAVNRILKNTTSGGTCVNSVMIHVGNSHLPFGGIGNSGMGNYHGFYGFRACSHERAVLRQTAIDSLKMFYPPYGAKVLKMVRRVIRYFS